jgi:hypothetical protein
MSDLSTFKQYNDLADRLIEKVSKDVVFVRFQATNLRG